MKHLQCACVLLATTPGCAWWVAAGVAPSLDTRAHTSVDATVRGGLGLGGIGDRTGTGMGVSMMATAGADLRDGTFRASLLAGAEMVHVGRRWGVVANTMAGVGAASGDVRAPVVRMAVGPTIRVGERLDRAHAWLNAIAVVPWGMYARNPNGNDEGVFGVSVEFLTLHDPGWLAEPAMPMVLGPPPNEPSRRRNEPYR